MMNLFNLNTCLNLKLLAIATSTLASLGILSISPARAALVEFDLTFFEDDVPVGFGEFSYDDAQPLEETFFDPGGLPSFEITAADGWFGLTDFSATIGSVSWDLGDSYFAAISWLPEESENSLGGVSFTRFGEPELRDWWLFGSPRYAPLLVMEQGDLSGNSWSQFSEDSADPTGGTWVAQAREVRPPSVPEPTTTLLMSGLVLGGGGLLKKRRQGVKTGTNGRSRS